MKRKFIIILTLFMTFYLYQTSAYSHFRFFPHSHTVKSGDHYVIVPSIPLNGFVQVKDTGINVRTGPGKKYDIIKNIPEGTILTVKGGSHLGLSNWIYVDIPGGGHGWINKKHTNKADSTQSASNEAETVPDRVVVTNQAYDIQKPYSKVMGKVRVSTDKLYVLSGPDEKYDAIDIMKKGTVLEVYGNGSHLQTKWLYIKRPGGDFGWIDDSFTESVEPVIILPETKETGTVIVTSNNLDVYAGPGSSYKIINSVKSGTKLEVFGVGKLGISKWIYIQMPDGENGWVNRNGTSVL